MMHLEGVDPMQPLVRDGYDLAIDLARLCCLRCRHAMIVVALVDQQPAGWLCTGCLQMVHAAPTPIGNGARS